MWLRVRLRVNIVSMKTYTVVCAVWRWWSAVVSVRLVAMAANRVSLVGGFFGKRVPGITNVRSLLSRVCGLQAAKQKELFRRIRAGHYTFPSPHWDGVSSNAKDLISCLLRINPAHRLTAEQVPCYGMRERRVGGGVV